MSKAGITPLFPGLANWVRYIWWHPCAEPFSVLVETLFPCVIELFVGLLLYDIGQFERDTTRFGVRELVAGGRGVSHLGRDAGQEGETRNRGRRTLKEKSVAKKITRSYAKTFMTVTDNLEGLLFIFLLYSVVDQFFYNWTSLLYARQYCSAHPTTGPLQAHTDSLDCAFSTEGVSFPFSTLDQNRANWGFNGVSATLPSGQYDITMSLTATAIGTPGPNAGIALYAIIGAARVLLAKSETVRLLEGTPVDIIFAYHLDARTQVFVSLEWETFSTDAPVGANPCSNARLMIYESSWMDEYQPL